jgi:2-oxoglutarate ferredoxin oxidoreductase subunit alpha
MLCVLCVYFVLSAVKYDYTLQLQPDKMIEMKGKETVFIDGSRLITESLVRAGADVFIGYPITPANLVYAYSERRFPTFFAAPDEITTLQWMSGFAITGHLPVTATSFPGYALMIESINMAYMMELPMVIVLIQRLGPATGTATCGAQGDLNVIYGTLSGGFPLPCIAVSSMHDCWDLPPKALQMAVDLRSPVVLLTSKEEVMTYKSFDMAHLAEVTPVKRLVYSGKEPYMPYAPMENLVPEFLPVSENKHQVRYTASTHDKTGIIQNTTPDALANSTRLGKKISENLDNYLYYDYDRQEDARTLLITYGITTQAAMDAVKAYRSEGMKASLLVMKTLSPVSKKYFDICSRYDRIVIAEENLDGELRRIMFGEAENSHITGVNKIGQMIEPGEILKALENHE